jgi:signal transduction histidine kinase
MTIRNRLTTWFSLAVLTIFLFFSCTVYFFSSEYRKNEFNNRLKQRVEITEKIFLESENSPEFMAVQQQFLNKLPMETEEVVEMTPSFTEQLKVSYPPGFIADAVANKEAFFEFDQRQGSGRIFHVNGKDYIVLLTAVDQVGIRMMEHLVTVIVVVMTACVLAMIAVSHFVSGSIINPISAKIRKANSIRASNLHERLAVMNPKDELGELTLAFNSLLDRVEQAFHTQKLFIDNASHEIRNPLTAIIGETGYILEKPRSAEQYVESLTSVNREADRLNNIVNDLLQLAGISQKDIAYGSEVALVNELLIGAKHKLDIKYPEKQIEVNFDGPGPFGSLGVEGNRHLLITAIFNLLDNACKFSSFRPVSVSVTHPRTDHVEITIRDHGIGIPERDLKRITEPFHRASNARQVIGTGLGIPLTAKIIDLHGGSLLVESTLNAGTVARVTLPVL